MIIICWPGEPNCQPECYDQFVQALPKGLLVNPLEVWGYPRNFLFTLRSLLMGRYDPAAAAGRPCCRLGGLNSRLFQLEVTVRPGRDELQGFKKFGTRVQPRGPSESSPLPTGTGPF